MNVLRVFESIFVSAAERRDAGFAALAKKDWVLAETELRAAAALGDTSAQVELGQLLNFPKNGSPPNHKEAAEWYRLAAEAGHPLAQYFMGTIHAFGYADSAEGDGIEQDFVTAAKWLRLAADQELSFAQNHLGTLYARGSGVPEDFREAARLYRLAADQGDPKGQFNFADCCRHGRGVPQDYVLAHMWYNLAAAQGDTEAARYRDDVAEIMTPEQVADAQGRARSWRANPKPIRLTR